MPFHKRFANGEPKAQAAMTHLPVTRETRQQTVDLVRLSIEVVESNIDSLLDPAVTSAVIAGGLEQWLDGISCRYINAANGHAERPRGTFQVPLYLTADPIAMPGVLSTLTEPLLSALFRVAACVTPSVAMRATRVSGASSAAAISCRGSSPMP